MLLVFVWLRGVVIFVSDDGGDQNLILRVLFVETFGPQDGATTAFVSRAVEIDHEEIDAKVEDDDGAGHEKNGAQGKEDRTKHQGPSIHLMDVGWGTSDEKDDPDTYCSNKERYPRPFLVTNAIVVLLCTICTFETKHMVLNNSVLRHSTCVTFPPLQCYVS